VIVGISLVVLATWIWCGIASYTRTRSYYRRMLGTWTKGDRLFHLVLALAGPIDLLATAILCPTKKGEEKANW
jgi:hypothetical protein